MYCERASTLMRLNRQGKGRNSIARNARRTTCTVRAGIRERKRATGSATGTTVSAAGSPSSPGAIASAIARRVLSSAALSPGGRLQGGAAEEPTRPASDQSSSEAKTSEPSTIPFSR